MEKELASLQTLVDRLIDFSVNYSMQVLGAIIVLILGVLLGKWAAKLIEKLCKRGNLDITLSKFLASVGKLLVVAFAVIIAMGKFGVKSLRLLLQLVLLHLVRHTPFRGHSQTMVQVLPLSWANLLSLMTR